MPNYTPDTMPIVLPVTRHMQGLEVQKMQMWLNELNDYYQFNPKQRIPESAFYGDLTIRMVKAFQKFCNLPPSGMYEFKTHEMVEWKYMNMNQNIEKEMEESNAAALFSDRKW
jgi:peptidoglycan hydrolase-like protein with peptidoglycan-binding domain